MLKTLFEKKKRELLAHRIYVMFALQFVLSFLPVIAFMAWNPETRFLFVLPVVVIGMFLGLACAVVAFGGDYLKETYRFLEFLPVTHSAIWVVGYLTGICLLAVSAFSLFALGVLLYQPALPDLNPVLENSLEHYAASRFAIVVSGAAVLFWMFSVAVFPVAFLSTGKKDAASVNLGWLLLTTFCLPIAVCAFLGHLEVFPSGMDLAPVLLVSAVLYSAGSYVLFARVPRHSPRAKRIAYGAGVFLICTSFLFGHLYLKHLVWRKIDASEKLVIDSILRPNLHGTPDFVLANVTSCRSGRHCLSIDAARSTYRDLGRRLLFTSSEGNEHELLKFIQFGHSGFRNPVSAVAMTPDGTPKHSIRLDGGDTEVQWRHLSWLQNPARMLYPAHSEETSQSYLCIADPTGKVLHRFEVDSYPNGYSLSPTNRILALAPMDEDPELSDEETPAEVEDPYMLIDADANTVFRFDLPGRPFVFAKDLRRVICSCERVDNGLQYQSYVLVEIPSLDESTLLPEGDFPPVEVTSQVTSRPIDALSLVTDSLMPTPFLRVNDAFDTACWIQRTVEGNYFHYSIILIDLDTGQRQVIVPKSETPRLPVVVREDRTADHPVTLHRFTADGGGLLFEMDRQFHLYDLAKQEYVLVADNRIPFDERQEGPRFHRRTELSPSGRRVLRHADVYRESPGAKRSTQFEFAAIDVYQHGKPTRVFRGNRPIEQAIWLDEERIIFCERHAIYSLNASGGPPRRIVPPET